MDSYQPTMKGNDMTTYWDMSEKERAELTEEEVRTLLKFELMEKGVVEPKAPNLQEVNEVDIGKAVKTFTVVGTGRWSDDDVVSFETLEDANKFIKLKPVTITHDYQMSDEYQYAKPITNMRVKQVERYSKDQILAVSTILKENKSKNEANEKAKEQYETAMEKVSKATGQVWDDYFDVLRKVVHHKKVMDTFDEYLEMTNDDRPMAFGFLKKAYTGDEIIHAFEHADLVLPFNEESEKEEAEEGSAE